MEYWPGFFLPFFRVLMLFSRIARRLERLVLYIIISDWSFISGPYFLNCSQLTDESI